MLAISQTFRLAFLIFLLNASFAHADDSVDPEVVRQLWLRDHQQPMKAPPTATKEAILAYGRACVAKINRGFNNTTVKAGEYGTGIVNVDVVESGKFHSIKVSFPSGNPTLDSRVQEVLRDVSCDPMPQEITDSRILSSKILIKYSWQFSRQTTDQGDGPLKLTLLVDNAAVDPKRTLDFGDANAAPPPDRNELIAQRRKAAEPYIARWKKQTALTVAEGDLEPNFDLGCVSLTDVTNQYNPPALMYAARKCVQQGEYSKAWPLIDTGHTFAYYDIKRVSDPTSRLALTALLEKAFGDLPYEQRQAERKKTDEDRSDQGQMKAFCAELTRIGHPVYEPIWVKLHGVSVNHVQHSEDYIINIDAKAVWDEAVKERCPVVSK